MEATSRLQDRLRKIQNDFFDFPAEFFFDPENIQDKVDIDIPEDAPDDLLDRVLGAVLHENANPIDNQPNGRRGSFYASLVARSKADEEQQRQRDKDLRASRYRKDYIPVQADPERNAVYRSQKHNGRELHESSSSGNGGQGASDPGREHRNASRDVLSGSGDAGAGRNSRQEVQRGLPGLCD